MKEHCLQSLGKYLHLRTPALLKCLHCKKKIGDGSLRAWIFPGNSSGDHVVVILVDVWDEGHFVLLPCSCVKEIVTQEASGNGAISGQAIKFWTVGTSSPVEGDTRVVVTNTWLGVVTNRLAESMTGETLQHSVRQSKSDSKMG